MLFNFHFVFFLVIGVFWVKGVDGGFELELIHRDSPFSPFYNHSTTSEERARDASFRSLARFNRVNAKEMSIEFLIHTNPGDFLVELLIGTPPTKVPVILDTGSDLIWVQCAPCINCFHQQSPLYDSILSSTYKSISCHEHLCKSLTEANCSIPTTDCQYSYRYEDRSTTKGTLATENFIFQKIDGHVATATGVIFGCGKENNLLHTAGRSGILGLGAGALSLVSQSRLTVERKFSYCLPRSTDHKGILKLGMNTSVSGGKVVSTALLTDEKNPSLYIVTLEGISVGGKKIAYKQVSSLKGNTVVDSGSTLNYIDPELHYTVVATLKETIGLQTVDDPDVLRYELCYQTHTFHKIPEQSLVFHFTGGDVELNNMNMFIPVKNMTCFSMQASALYGDYNLYGNIAQKDFEVEYNLETMVISFARVNCSENLKKAAGVRIYTRSVVFSLMSATLVFILM